MSVVQTGNRGFSYHLITAGFSRGHWIKGVHLAFICCRVPSFASAHSLKFGLSSLFFPLTLRVYVEFIEKCWWEFTGFFKICPVTQSGEVKKKKNTPVSKYVFNKWNGLWKPPHHTHIFQHSGDGWCSFPTLICCALHLITGYSDFQAKASTLSINIKCMCVCAC